MLRPHEWLTGTEVRVWASGEWRTGTVKEWYRDPASGAFWFIIGGPDFVNRHVRERDLMFCVLPVGAVA